LHISKINGRLACFYSILPSSSAGICTKKSDIRVVVFENELFAIEIFSQDNELSKDDFRGVAPDFLHHSQHELPDVLKEQIKSFVRRQNLVFSSMDLVLSQNDEYFFIENNPNGQWLWLELATELNLSDAFIRLLSS